MKKILLVTMLTLASSTTLASTECTPKDWVEKLQFNNSNNVRERLFNNLANTLLETKTNTQRKEISKKISDIKELSSLKESCFRVSIIELNLLNKPIA